MIVNYFFPAMSVGPNVRDVVTPLATGQLLATDGMVHVSNNTGANFAIIPPAGVLSGYRVRIKDALGNAGSHAITFQGVIDGQTNPTLIDVNFTWAEIEFWQGNWYRIA